MQTKPPERYEYDNVVILKHRTPSAALAWAFYDEAIEYPTHNHGEACFMLNGSSVYRETLGSKTYYHPAHALIWRQPNIVHNDGFADPNSQSFSIFLNDDLIQQIAEVGSIPSEFTESNTDLVYLAGRLRKEFQNWGVGSELITEGLILEMLGHAQKLNVPQHRQPPYWLTKTIDKLETEFMFRHTNQNLAAEAGVHPVHFARTFRRYHGKTVGSYLKERRIQRAMVLLENKLSLSEIAYQCGFSDQSQFNKAF